jgi:AraC-like DNA-binding protein
MLLEPAYHPLDFVVVLAESRDISRHASHQLALDTWRFWDWAPCLLEPMSELVAPSILSSWTRTIADALLVAGVDVVKVLSEAGFSYDDFRDPNARLPAEATAKLWRVAVAHTGDPAFGLEAARYVTQTTFHGLGVAVLASATLRDGLRRLVRYNRLVCDAQELCLEVTNGAARLSMRPREDAGEAPEQPAYEATDAVMALIVRTCRLVTNRAFGLEHIQFKRPKPRDPAPYERAFRCPLRFGANEDAMVFDAALLDRALVMANPELARRNDEAVREYLARIENGSIIDLVRGKLIHRLADKPSPQEIARALGMSQRSMQRRLHESGTSYEAVLGEVRKELACAYLREGRYSVGELAFTLGFEDASAFARAFRRWTGVSPSTFRAEPSTIQ